MPSGHKDLSKTKAEILIAITNHLKKKSHLIFQQTIPNKHNQEGTNYIVSNTSGTFQYTVVQVIQCMSEEKSTTHQGLICTQVKVLFLHGNVLYVQ